MCRNKTRYRRLRWRLCSFENPLTFIVANTYVSFAQTISYKENAIIWAKSVFLWWNTLWYLILKLWYWVFPTRMWLSKMYDCCVWRLYELCVRKTNNIKEYSSPRCHCRKPWSLTIHTQGHCFYWSHGCLGTHQC